MHEYDIPDLPVTVHLCLDPFSQSQQVPGESSSQVPRTSNSLTKEELEFERMIREHELLFQDSQDPNEEEHPFIGLGKWKKEKGHGRNRF